MFQGGTMLGCVFRREQLVASSCAFWLFSAGQLGNKFFLRSFFEFFLMFILLPFYISLFGLKCEETFVPMR